MTHCSLLLHDKIHADSSDKFVIVSRLRDVNNSSILLLRRRTGNDFLMNLKNSFISYICRIFVELCRIYILEFYLEIYLNILHVNNIYIFILIFNFKIDFLLLKSSLFFFFSYKFIY